MSLNIKEINLIEGWRQHIFYGLCSTEFVFLYFEKFRFSSCPLCMSTLRISIKTMLFSKKTFTIHNKRKSFIKWTKVSFYIDNSSVSLLLHELILRRQFLLNVARSVFVISETPILTANCGNRRT